MMALTLEAEQRMTDAGVLDYYSKDEAAWLVTVKATHAFVSGNFPAGALIRRDDVAKALIPLLEVHEGFKDFRNTEKLRGRFWTTFFADLLIDRTWDELQNGDGNV